MNIGSRLWIISDEMSIDVLTKPSIHTPAGICVCHPTSLRVYWLFWPRQAIWDQSGEFPVFVMIFTGLHPNHDKIEIGVGFGEIRSEMRP